MARGSTRIREAIALTLALSAGACGGASAIDCTKLCSAEGLCSAGLACQLGYCVAVGQDAARCPTLPTSSSSASASSSSSASTGGSGFASTGSSGVSSSSGTGSSGSTGSTSAGASSTSTAAAGASSGSSGASSSGSTGGACPTTQLCQGGCCNLGTGAFGAASYITGLSPRGLDFADFDGDGRLDMVVGSAVPNGLHVLLNDGDGGFTVEPLVSTYSGVRTLAVGDFDRDGHVDVALTWYDADFAKIAEGLADGGVAPEVMQTDAGVSATTAVALIDVDGDGILDLVQLVFGSSLRIEYGYADAGLGPLHTLPTCGETLTHADLHHDGRSAPLVGCSDGGIDTFEAASPGAVLTQTHGGFSGVSIQALVARDLDGDGIPDLAFTDRSSNMVRVARGNAAGTYTLVGSLATPGIPDYLDVGDVDGDGLVDVVVDTSNNGKVQVMLSQPSGALVDGGVYSYAASISGTVVRLADIDGDHKLDIIIDGLNANDIAILRGR